MSTAPWTTDAVLCIAPNGCRWYGLPYAREVERRLRYPAGKVPCPIGQEDEERMAALLGASYLHQFRVLVTMPRREREAVIQSLRAHDDKHRVSA